MVALAVFALLAARGRRPLLFSLLALAMILPPLFAGVRATLVFVPLMLGLVLVRAFGGGRWGRGRGGAVVAVILVICLGLASLSVLYGRVVAPNAFTLSYALKRESSSGSVGTGRVTAVRDAARQIGRRAVTSAVGFGPGLVSESRLRNGQPLTLSFVGGRNQISSTLLETGWAGLVCLLGSAVLLVAAGWRRFRPCGDAVLDAVRLAFLPVGLLFILMFGYFQVWGSYASLLAFMLLLAAVRAPDASPFTAAAALPSPDTWSEP
jgi:O-antigen ligase